MSRPRAAPDRKAIERFHHLAIRLLRGLRRVDEAHGFSGPRASALSVLVFRGPQSLGELAAAEGVKAPTMSRLVKAMQSEGLVETEVTSDDQRRMRIAAIAKLFENATPAEAKALETVVELLARALDEA